MFNNNKYNQINLSKEEVEIPTTLFYLCITVLEEGEIMLVAYVEDGANSSGLKEVEGEVDGMECQ